MAEIHNTTWRGPDGIVHKAHSVLGSGLLVIDGVIAIKLPEIEMGGMFLRGYTRTDGLSGVLFKGHLSQQQFGYLATSTNNVINLGVTKGNNCLAFVPSNGMILVQHNDNNALSMYNWTGEHVGAIGAPYDVWGIHHVEQVGNSTKPIMGNDPSLFGSYQGKQTWLINSDGPHQVMQVEDPSTGVLYVDTRDRAKARWLPIKTQIPSYVIYDIVTDKPWIALSGPNMPEADKVYDLMSPWPPPIVIPPPPPPPPPVDPPKPPDPPVPPVEPPDVPPPAPAPVVPFWKKWLDKLKKWLDKNGIRIPEGIRLPLPSLT